jgi:hypothetical protein
LDDLNLTVGDLITHGTFLLNETPEYWQWITREGELMFVWEEMKPHVLQALVDQNKREANAFSRTSSHGPSVKVASIPIILFFELQRKGIANDPVAIRRFLNDPDNAHFRTNDWRL